MTGTQTIRAFIAIHLPDSVKAELGLVGDVLAGQVPAKSVRWVQPALLHLTLCFLGDTAVSKLPAIYDELDRVAAAQPPFTLQLDDLGCFPNPRRPRVIWVGLTGEVAAVQQLKTALDEVLAPLGWPPEDRPFRAHLTLGRVKDSRKLQNVSWGTEVKRLAIPVTAVHLVESQLRPSGPVYTTRHISEFRKP